MSDVSLLETADFKYGSFISNYKKDDIDDKLRDLIKYFVDLMEGIYSSQFERNETTSVSNFLKTDAKYQNVILKKVFQELNRQNVEKELLGEDGYCVIFKRV